MHKMFIEYPSYNSGSLFQHQFYMKQEIFKFGLKWENFNFVLKHVNGQLCIKTGKRSIQKFKKDFSSKWPGRATKKNILRLPLQYACLQYVFIYGIYVTLSSPFCFMDSLSLFHLHADFIIVCPRRSNPFYIVSYNLLHKIKTSGASSESGKFE